MHFHFYRIVQIDTTDLFFLYFDYTFSDFSTLRILTPFYFYRLPSIYCLRRCRADDDIGTARERKTSDCACRR